MNKNRPPIVVSIAGFDGSGGAGIQTDLKTFSALGCYGATVLTALPVQNTMGVKSVYPISDECLSEQLEALIEDMEIDAVKIGMLDRPEAAAIAARFWNGTASQKSFSIRSWRLKMGPFYRARALSRR